MTRYARENNGVITYSSKPLTRDEMRDNSNKARERENRATLQWLQHNRAALLGALQRAKPSAAKVSITARYGVTVFDATGAIISQMTKGCALSYMECNRVEA